MKQPKVKNLKKVSRRRFSAVEKRSIILETYKPGKNISLVARSNHLSPSLLYKWRHAMEDGELKGIESDSGIVSAKEVKKLKARINSLETALGRKSLDVEILKEAVKIAREKKLISRQPLVGIDDFQ